MINFPEYGVSFRGSMHYSCTRGEVYQKYISDGCSVETIGGSIQLTLLD